MYRIYLLALNPETFPMRGTTEGRFAAQVLEKLAGPPQTTAPALSRAELTEQFRALKEALEGPVTFERRRFGRIALPILLRVTPLDQTGQRLEDLAMTVVGKDISPRGISFFHEHPLPYRRAMVAFDHPDVGHFAMEVDITWCQFTAVSWYVSGGRLIRAGARQSAPPPTE
jgi:hypothetical protein